MYVPPPTSLFSRCSRPSADDWAPTRSPCQDLPAPREFRQVLFSPWNQHTLRSMGITQGMQTSRRLEPWQERWVEIVKEYSNVVAVCCSDSVIASLPSHFPSWLSPN